jgi:hypothetical protein
VPAVLWARRIGLAEVGWFLHHRFCTTARATNDDATTRLRDRQDLEPSYLPVIRLEAA